jgi:predicted alpha/beta superfamily hydrolase
MGTKGNIMGKWFVWAWIAVVVATLVGMQAWLFGSRGLPRFSGPESAKLGAQPAVKPSTPVPSPTDASGAKTVQPESLPQGFIVMVTDKSQRANASSPIHMASSHNGWNPADPKMQLQAQSDQKWRIVWEKPTLDSRIAFKFARGSWDNVEVTSDFKDVENRMLPMVDVSKLKPGEKPVIELEVANWHDAMPGSAKASATDRYRAISVKVGSLQRVEVVGGGGPGASALSRDLLVWLPPGYDAPENRTRTYPVLYMMDGQHLFEKIDAAPASWSADETAAKQIADGKVEPLIIVGIPNAAGLRSQEYLPFAMVDKVEPHGAEFIQFLVGEVKPRIERAFRVRTGPESTGVGGASLGAIIALEAGTTHPELFGNVLAESTPLVAKDRAAFRHFAGAKAWPEKIAFGMGGKEAGKDAANEAMNKQYTAAASAFKELAQGHGLTANRFRLTIDEGAVHNEEAWGKRFGGALEFLFPASK